MTDIPPLVPHAVQLSIFGEPRPLWDSWHHPRSLAPGDVGMLDGNAFDYAEYPGLFLGRSGVGPLRLAWDSDILIDYAESGTALWEHAHEADFSHLNHAEDVVALGGILDHWMIRDIRIHLFSEQLDEFRRSRDSHRVQRRVKQLEAIKGSLACLGDTEENRGPDELPRSGRLDLSFVPGNSDRMLLTAAIRAGCHVFLTRDRQLLRKCPRLARYGIRVMSPVRLLDDIAINRRSLFQGLAPDTHKWTHLMGACE